MCLISVLLIPSLCFSHQGGGSSSGADICQSNIQFFPGLAALLFSVSGSFTCLFSSTSCYSAESVHTSTYSDICSCLAGGSGTANCCTVRYSMQVVVVKLQIINFNPFTLSMSITSSKRDRSCLDVFHCLILEPLYRV